MAPAATTAASAANATTRLNDPGRLMNARRARMREKRGFRRTCHHRRLAVSAWATSADGTAGGPGERLVLSRVRR